LRAKVEGRIPQLEPVLTHLDHLGFRLSVKTRGAVLKLAGE
jgi:predicted nucleic acid-binding protein